MQAHQGSEVSRKGYCPSRSRLKKFLTEAGRGPVSVTTAAIENLQLKAIVCPDPFDKPYPPVILLSDKPSLQPD